MSDLSRHEFLESNATSRNDSFLHLFFNICSRQQRVEDNQFHLLSAVQIDILNPSIWCAYDAGKFGKELKLDGALDFFDHSVLDELNSVKDYIKSVNPASIMMVADKLNNAFNDGEGLLAILIVKVVIILGFGSNIFSHRTWKDTKKLHYGTLWDQCPPRLMAMIEATIITSMTTYVNDPVFWGGTGGKIFLGEFKANDGRDAQTEHLMRTDREGFYNLVSHMQRVNEGNRHYILEERSMPMRYKRNYESFTYLRKFYVFTLYFMLFTFFYVHTLFLRV